MRQKILLLAAGFLVGAMAVQAADQTWDPDGDTISNGGAGIWDTITGNWITAAPWVNGNNAIFGDSGGNDVVSIADGGVTVGDLTHSGTSVLQFKSVNDNLGVIAIKAGGATWNTGGGKIQFLNDTANDVSLSISSGDTLTIAGGGEFDTGEKPTGADWVATGATLDIGVSTLVRGNAASVGNFGMVKLGANSTYIHERNSNQGYANNWQLGGGTITFGNRWQNNGNITVNGTISGNADEMVIDMATPTSGNRLFVLTQAAAYAAGTNRVAEGTVQLNTDDALSSSVLVLGGAAGKNSSVNLNGNNQTIKGLYNDIGNTREVRNNAAATTSTLTIDVEAGNNFTYVANFNGGGTINLVKDGLGTQEFSRTGGHTTSIGNITVNNGMLVWNVNGGGVSGTTTVGANGTLGGSGIFNGAVTVAGNLKPGNSPGTMTFNDSLTLESTSTLSLEFVSATAGDFDVLANDGGDTLTVGGILALDATGYTAALADTFTVFENWSGFSGSFDSITGTDLGGGLSFDTSNLLVDGTLTVIPEPATLGLAAIMGGGIFWIRRVFMV